MLRFMLAEIGLGTAKQARKWMLVANGRDEYTTETPAVVNLGRGARSHTCGVERPTSVLRAVPECAPQWADGC
jgi:hypothetical protein